MTAAHATSWSNRVDGQSANSSRAGGSKRNRETTGAIVLGIVDFALVWLSAGVALSFRVDQGAINYGTMLAKNAGFLMLLSILVVLFCQAQKLYEFQAMTALEEIVAILKSVALATILLSASIYLSGQKVVSRVALGITVFLAATSLASWRYWRRQRIARRTAKGQDCRNVLIFGWSHAAGILAQHFVEHGLPGHVVKGFLDRRRENRTTTIGADERRRDTTKAMGNIDELCDIVRAHFIDEVLVFLPEDRESVKKLIADSRKAGVGLRVIPDFYDGLAWGAAVEHLGPFPAIRVHEKQVPILELIVKRCIDVVGCAVALLLSLPLCFVIAVAIRLDSPGPLLYRSKRVGRKGTTFTCYKFRTMVQNADALKDRLSDLNERTGILFKIANDPRITRVGRILRKYSLDEIPQFWNVLIGDMSLVGPRPPIPGEYQQYELDHLKRLHVLPGITGLWQVQARRDPSFENYIHLDMHYVDNWSLWLDFKILLKTASVVVAGTGQ
jgi:exopolysaccharide biosynthesis polyprenyl glycosylphosphotransferase